MVHECIAIRESSDDGYLQFLDSIRGSFARATADGDPLFTTDARDLMTEEFGPVVATGLVAMVRRGVPDVHVGSALYLAAESGDTDAIRALAYLVGMSCPSASGSDRSDPPGDDD